MVLKEQHAPSTCPSCKKVLDASTGLVEGGTPSEGDFSLCLYCSQLLRFGPNLELRAIKLSEARRLLDHSVYLRLKRAMELLPKMRHGAS